MSRRRLVEGVATAALVTAVGIVVALATGLMSIVVTHGVSMLPRFHTGDLAVVWASGGYHVGQIVAYKSAVLRSTVLHRIVADHGGLFTFKGDNNSFLDPERLPASAIRGSLVLHIPHAGAWLDWVKQPVHMALILAGLLLLYGIAIPTVVRRRARPLSDDGARSARPTKEPSASSISGMAFPLTMAAASALVFGAIAGVAWSRPLVQRASEPVHYSQHVNFSYHAAVPPSVVYPSGVVRTGQPVFLNLVQSVDVSAHFSFATKAWHTSLTGTMAGTVKLVYGTGWSTLLERLPAVPLRSSQGTVTAPIDLARVSQLVAAVNKATGGEAGMPTIVVTATVKSRGDVLGQPVRARFSPSLTFDMTLTELSVASFSNANGSSGPNQLEQSEPGSVYQRVLKPATLAALGRSIRVSTARDIGAVGAGASLGVALALVGWGLWRRRQGEAAQIEARYGPELIGVRTAPEDNRRKVIDVVGMPALAKVAETYGSGILDHSEESTHTFYVDAGTAIYRYRPASRVPPGAEREPARDQPERPKPSRQIGPSRQASAELSLEAEQPDTGHAAHELEVISAFRRQLEEQPPEDRAAALVREEEQAREQNARLLLEAEALSSSAERGATPGGRHRAQGAQDAGEGESHSRTHPPRVRP